MTRAVKGGCERSAAFGNFTTFLTPAAGKWGVFQHVEVSKNGGFPEQTYGVFLPKIIILGCFGGTTILGNTHISSLKLTAKAPEIDAWNTSLLLGRPIFGGNVSFREGSHRPWEHINYGPGTQPLSFLIVPWVIIFWGDIQAMVFLVVANW